MLYKKEAESNSSKLAASQIKHTKKNKRFELKYSNDRTLQRLNEIQIYWIIFVSQKYLYIHSPLVSFCITLRLYLSQTLLLSCLIRKIHKNAFFLKQYIDRKRTDVLEIIF